MLNPDNVLYTAHLHQINESGALSAQIVQHKSSSHPMSSRVCALKRSRKIDRRGVGILALCLHRQQVGSLGLTLAP